MDSSIVFHAIVESWFHAIVGILVPCNSGNPGSMQ